MSKKPDVSCTLDSKDIDKMFTQNMLDATFNNDTPFFQIITFWNNPILHHNLFISTYLTQKCWNEHFICTRLVAIGQSVEYYTIQCKFLWILKLTVRVVGRASRIQLNGLCLAVFCYRLLIRWPIRQYKWNWYCAYSFSENRLKHSWPVRALTSIVLEWKAMEGSHFNLCGVKHPKIHMHKHNWSPAIHFHFICIFTDSSVEKKFWKKFAVELFHWISKIIRFCCRSHSLIRACIQM